MAAAYYSGGRMSRMMKQATAAVAALAVLLLSLNSASAERHGPIARGCNDLLAETSPLCNHALSFVALLKDSHTTQLLRWKILVCLRPEG